MSDSEKNDHWKAIGEQVGAAPSVGPPAAEPTPPGGSPGEQAEPDSGAAAHRLSRRRRQPQRPRHPADWDAVAAEFGIATPSAVSSRPSQQGQTPEAAEDESLAAASQESLSRSSQTGRFAPAEEPWPPPETGDADQFVETGDADQFVETGAPGTDLAVSHEVEVRDAEDSVSVEQVGAGDEAEEDEGLRLVRRRRRRRGRKRSLPEAAALETPSIDAAFPEAEVDEESGISTTDEPEDRDAPEKVREDQLARKRRRRRRHPPRQEPSEAVGEAARPEPAGDEPADSEALDEESEDLSGEDQTASPWEGKDSAAALKAKHRKIPTWAEAVGIVIAANMEARAKNPGGDPRGGSKGKGHGRGPRHG